jgi:copper transport protein
MVSLGPVTRIAGESAATMMAQVPAPVAAGTYTVRWTAAADDGHAMKGSFSFVITAARPGP